MVKDLQVIFESSKVGKTIVDRDARRLCDSLFHSALLENP